MHRAVRDVAMFWSFRRKHAEWAYSFHVARYFQAAVDRNYPVAAMNFSAAVTYAKILGIPSPPVIGEANAQPTYHMGDEEFLAWVREGQRKEVADPEARKFRDEHLEASRQEFMGPQRMGPGREVMMSEPQTFMGQMPVAPEVGETLECTNPECGAVTDGDEPRWSDAAVSPQGKWMLVKGVWRHHCGPGTWRLAEKVNPWAEAKDGA